MALHRRRAVVVAAAVLLVGAGIGAAVAAGAFGPSAAQLAAEAAAAARHRLVVAETRAVDRASRVVDVRLPARGGHFEPAEPASLFTRALPAHAVYGFVPYWELTSLTPADYRDVSVVSYFGIEVGASGAIIHSGYGWDDAHLSSFTSFVGTAHAAGDRVLLTVSTTDPAVISHLTRFPAATSARLAASILPVESADGLDGVDIDIEGRAAADRRGFVAFVADLARALHRGDPTGEIALDTYPESAGAPSDFFDVHRLARSVDVIFVMAYDMENPQVSSANSPLASPTLGLSDVGALRAYVRVVPARKLVLGLPFYGLDYTVAGKSPGSRSLEPDPVEVTYASVAAADRPALWDPSSLTPYALYRAGGKWHQTWYDDPISLAVKTSLAAYYHLGGVGAWALGQEGTSTAMLEALDGGARPLKLPLLHA
jgi:spore germination protein YaaH